MKNTILSAIILTGLMAGSAYANHSRYVVSLSEAASATFVQKLETANGELIAKKTCTIKAYNNGKIDRSCEKIGHVEWITTK